MRLLHQLEAACYAHGGAALSRHSVLSTPGHMLAQSVPAAAHGAGAAAPAAAHRCLHSQACRPLQAESAADKQALAALALSAGSSRFASGSSAHLSAHLLERRSGLSAMLRTPVAAADSRPAGGGNRPAGSPAQQGWQQERRHWAAANAVQPAAANSPALQYTPRFMPPPRWREPVGQPLGVPPPVQQQPPAQPLLAVSPPQPPPAQWQGVQVAGVVHRVTYRAQETGFCVLKLQVFATSHLVARSHCRNGQLQ